MNRYFGALWGDTLSVPVVKGLEVEVDAQDLHGPSFYLLHGGAAAFFHYEEAEKSEVLQALSPDGIFLDVGANIGLFSLYVARLFPGASIHAFEPLPLHVKRLNRSIAQSGIKNVKVHEKCLGASKSYLELYLHTNNSGGHSTRKDQIDDHERGTSIQVEVVDLDSFLTSRDRSKVDVIKIDVQGAEWSVLQGAQKTLMESRPVLLMEMDNAELRGGDSSLGKLHQLGLSDYFVKRAGETSWRNSKELPGMAAEDLQRGRKQTNYCFKAQEKLTKN